MALIPPMAKPAWGPMKTESPVAMSRTPPITSTALPSSSNNLGFVHDYVDKRRKVLFRMLGQKIEVD